MRSIAENGCVFLSSCSLAFNGIAVAEVSAPSSLSSLTLCQRFLSLYLATKEKENARDTDNIYYVNPIYISNVTNCKVDFKKG